MASSAISNEELVMSDVNDFRPESNEMKLNRWVILYKNNKRVTTTLYLLRDNSDFKSQILSGNNINNRIFHWHNG